MRKSCIFILGLFFAGPLCAEPAVISDGRIEEAWEEVKSYQNHLSSQRLVSSAETGDFKAALQLAAYLLSGTPDHASLTKAIQALTPFADGGRPEACFLLAKLRLHPAIADEAGARLLLEPLAREDWIPAMLLLAELGSGRWLARASLLGNPQAQYLQALKGFEQGETENANSLLNRSAGQFFLPAMLLSAERALRAGDYAGAIMWYSRAAESGHQEAFLDLARLYLRGLGVPVSVGRAWLLANQALGSHSEVLGYLQGNSAPTRNENSQQAKLRQLLYQGRYKAFLKDIEKHSVDLPADLNYRAGYLLKSGVVKKDYHLAREYYLRAAVLGYQPAVNGLGVLYEKGLGVERSYAEALAYYLLAAEQGYQKAMLNLVELYMESQQWDKAGEWLARVTKDSPRFNAIKSRYHRLRPK